MMVFAAAAMVAVGPALAQQTAPVRILFAADSDSVSAAGRAQLDRLAGQLGDGSLVIAGHADASDGEEAYTIGLTQRRANAVRDYLVTRGVKPGNMTTTAYGRSRPVGTTRGDAALNRRVEVTIGPGPGW